MPRKIWLPLLLMLIFAYFCLVWSFIVFLEPVGCARLLGWITIGLSSLSYLMGFVAAIMIVNQGLNGEAVVQGAGWAIWLVSCLCGLAAMLTFLVATSMQACCVSEQQPLIASQQQPVQFEP